MGNREWGMRKRGVRKRGMDEKESGRGVLVVVVAVVVSQVGTRCNGEAGGFAQTKRIVDPRRVGLARRGTRAVTAKA